MTGWTSDDLTRIGTADELELASVRRDGTLRKPRTIWMIANLDAGNLMIGVEPKGDG